MYLTLPLHPADHLHSSLRQTPQVTAEKPTQVDQPPKVSGAVGTLLLSSKVDYVASIHLLSDQNSTEAFDDPPEKFL